MYKPDWTDRDFKQHLNAIKLSLWLWRMLNDSDSNDILWEGFSSESHSLGVKTHLYGLQIIYSNIKIKSRLKK